MRVLITGAFGNIGKFLISELLKQNYHIKCFVLPSAENKKIAQKTEGVEVFYGDIRKKEDIESAIRNCDVVIHLAFISPDICQKDLSFAYQVNVGGTKNLVEAIKENSKNIKIIFASSISVYFYKLYRKSRKIKSLRHIEYVKHKLECEKIIKSSLSSWCILRLGAVLPTKFPIFHDLLSIPYNAHFEFIHIRDVVTALINAIKIEEAVRKVLLIGGRKEFCMQYRNFVNDLFRITDREIPKKSDFTSQPYLTDCFNTTESQKILKYQKHSYKDFLREMRHQNKRRLPASFSGSLLG